MGNRSRAGGNISLLPFPGTFLVEVGPVDDDGSHVPDALIFGVYGAGSIPEPLLTLYGRDCQVAEDVDRQEAAAGGGRGGHIAPMQRTTTTKLR